MHCVHRMVANRFIFLAKWPLFSFSQVLASAPAVTAEHRNTPPRERALGRLSSFSAIKWALEPPPRFPIRSTSLPHSFMPATASTRPSSTRPNGDCRSSAPVPRGRRVKADLTWMPIPGTVGADLRFTFENKHANDPTPYHLQGDEDLHRRRCHRRNGRPSHRPSRSDRARALLASLS